MNNDKETSVVYSAEGGEVTQQGQATAQTQTAQPQAAQSQAAAQGGDAHDSEYVEYEPVVYTDPGAVTEQFDELATRDPEKMLDDMGSGHTHDTGHLETEPFSPEAAALAGGNEATYGNRGGAVTRVESDAYDLADAPDNAGALDEGV